MAQLDEQFVGPLDATRTLEAVLREALGEPGRLRPDPRAAALRLHRRTGAVYAVQGPGRERGGMRTSRAAVTSRPDKALLSMTPAQIIDEVSRANLRGLGGAGFPTGRKWSFIPKASPKPRYLVVNADEGEPGTFKDRYILERDPHALLEGMVIAAHAIGSHKAYVYIRGEYFRPARRFSRAVEEAYATGWLGRNIQGSGFDLDVVIHRGAGAYICGEETALLTSLEGGKGFPRLKPPFPAISGLFQCPTIVNNVETLACVPFILREGAERFAAPGHGQAGRHQAVLGVRARESARPLRGAGGRDACASSSTRYARGRPRRPEAQGRHPRWNLRESAHGGRDRCQHGLRLADGGRHHGRLRRRDRDGRDHLHGRGPPVRGQVLRPRVVRSVLSLPGGNRLGSSDHAPYCRGRRKAPGPGRSAGHRARHGGQDDLRVRGRGGLAGPVLHHEVPGGVRGTHPDREMRPEQRRLRHAHPDDRRPADRRVPMAARSSRLRRGSGSSSRATATTRGFPSPETAASAWWKWRRTPSSRSPAIRR